MRIKKLFFFGVTQGLFEFLFFSEERLAKIPLDVKILNFEFNIKKKYFNVDDIESYVNE